MLALPLVLLFALPASPLGTAGAPSVNERALPPSSILPYGSAQGSWSAAEFRQDGSLTALLLDPAGYPAFAFNGRMDAAGAIFGELEPMVFAFGATTGLAALKVVGQAQLPVEDGARFSATIFSPLEGPIPVHPFGAIEGVLLIPSHRSLVGAPAATAVQGLEAELGFTPRPQIIVCPAGRVASHSGHNAGHPGAASGSAVRPIVMIAPQVPGLHRAPTTEVHATKAKAAFAAPALPPRGEGSLRARWYLLP
jgi:hypothetical protein